MNHTDAAFLRRALELAESAEGLASPNPQVGCVIVRDGRVAGEGTHVYDGVQHAETLALERAGAAAAGSTVYVNLEPCAHQGRTGPCAEALVTARVARVVTGMRDPNPLVCGRGLARLRDAGIAVEEAGGAPRDECRRLNERFARYIRGGVFVTLKGAMTLDGRIAAPDHPRGRPSPITGEAARAWVERLRHRHDALVTGIGTVLADDPLLTDRSGLPRRRPLLRLVMDSALRTPPGSRLVQSARGDLCVVCCRSAPEARGGELEKLGVEVLRLGPGDAARPLWPALVEELRRREILGVLLEAGAALNASALESGVVDKVALFYAPTLLGGEDALPLLGGRGFRTWENARPVRFAEMRRVGDDFLVEGYLRDAYED